MFENFTEKAIKVIMLAQEEARRLGHNFVGTEQILLGLIGEGTGVAAKVLRSMGVNLKDARIEVEKIIGRGSGFVAVEIPFTPNAKRVLERSQEEARQLGHDYISTEHLLLGLIREGEGVAARVLKNLGVDLSKVRTQLIINIRGIMATVGNFNRSMIENYLRDKNLKFLIDRDGDFRVEFGYDNDLGCDITVYFTAEGRSENVYTIRIFSDKRISKSDWGRAIMLCNTWNKDKRWPTAYLQVSNPDTDRTGKINLEYHLDLSQGIHQELLDDWTNTIISCGITFWTWAHQEQGF